MNSIKQIMAFIAVAEASSFTLAAAELHLSTMAVSKQVKNLEHAIKEELFIRSTRQVSLTEFGEQFYLQCKRLEKNWLELDEFISSRKLEPQGKLRVCVSRAFGKNIFLKKLREFNLAYPKIELEVELSEEPQMLDFQAGNFDVLFGFPELTGITDNLKYRKLHKTKNILCASKEFVDAYGRPEKIEDLVDFKFINHALREPRNVMRLADGESVLTSMPEIVMNSFDGLTQACLDGCGIVLTGDLLVKKHIEKGRLVVLLPDLNYREFELYLFYRPTHYEQPSVRAFVDFYAQ